MRFRDHPRADRNERNEIEWWTKRKKKGKEEGRLMMAAWRVVESVAVDQSGDDFWWQTARRGNGGPAAVRVAAPLRHAIGSSLALLLPRRFSLISAFGVVRVKTPTEIRSTIKKNPKKLRKFKRKNFPSLRFIFCKKKKIEKQFRSFVVLFPSEHRKQRSSSRIVSKWEMVEWKKWRKNHR